MPKFSTKDFVSHFQVPSLDFSVLFSVTKPFSRDDGLKKEIGHKNKHMACYENGAFFLNTRMEI